MPDNYFQKLCEVDVREHVEKKGKFSYLSWAWAVQELGKIDPTATWEVVKYDGLPYLKTELGYFVEVAVTVQGVKKSQIHPILDHNNKPHPKPTSFDVNTSIQRALVKAIALHGLGLYIYAGEDLPPGDDTERKMVEANIKPAAGVEDYLSEEQKKALYSRADEVGELIKKQAFDEALDLYRTSKSEWSPEEETFFCELFPAKVRRFFKEGKPKEAA